MYESEVSRGTSQIEREGGANEGGLELSKWRNLVVVVVETLFIVRVFTILPYNYVRLNANSH